MNERAHKCVNLTYPDYISNLSAVGSLPTALLQVNGIDTRGYYSDSQMMLPELAVTKKKPLEIQIICPVIGLLPQNCLAWAQQSMV